MRVSNNRVTPSSMQTALERKHSRAAGSKGAFLETLRQAKVTFSKHAEQRLRAWKEADKDGLIGELNSAMDLAQAKGARSTLVLMKGVAFVVAPQSRTVVTVIPEDRMKHNLFTSIDSAVLVDK
ncbi:MAG: flagellar biosynthesis protein [Bacillota bacterium]|jgi:flagellar operon protein|nr:flagellar biosynthesis protein [Candidatus Fermentithermobacillaceae bacterium]